MRLVRVCAVLRDLRDSGPATREEIAAMVDTSPETAWHWIAVLTAEGVLRVCGRRGQAYLYELAPAGTPRKERYTRKKVERGHPSPPNGGGPYPP